MILIVRVPPQARRQEHFKKFPTDNSSFAIGLKVVLFRPSMASQFF